MSASLADFFNFIAGIRRWLFIGFGVAVAILAIWAVFGNRKRPAEAETAPSMVSGPIRREVVTSKPTETGIAVPATVEAARTSVLSAQITARVGRVHVIAGQAVRRGQTLVELDSAVQKAGLDARTAETVESWQAVTALERRSEAAEASIATARAEYDLAKTLADRQEKLFSTGDVPRQSRDIAAARLETAAANLKLAEKQRDAAAAERARADAHVATARAYGREAFVQIELTRIAAPFDGRVTLRQADPGTLAGPGVPLLTVESAEPFRAVATVDESVMRGLRVGQPLDVELPALGNERFSGRIVEILPVADLSSRTFAVKIQLPVREELRGGMFARVWLPGASGTAMSVTRTAVMTEGGLESLFVLDAGGVVRRRIVTTGATRGERVEILSGLRDGETVVFGNPDLRDGALVK